MTVQTLLYYWSTKKYFIISYDEIQGNYISNQSLTCCIKLVYIPDLQAVQRDGLIQHSEAAALLQ